MNLEKPSPQRFKIVLDLGGPELKKQWATLSRSEEWMAWHKLQGMTEEQLSSETVEVTVMLDTRYMLLRLTRHNLTITIRQIVFMQMESSTGAFKLWLSRTLHGLNHVRMVIAIVIGLTSLGGLIVHAPWSIQIVRKADAANVQPAPVIPAKPETK